jgi:hypothetical protein
MSKVIKLTREDIANIVKKVIKEASEDRHDELISPVFMSLSVNDRGFRLFGQYSIPDNNDDGSYGLNVFYDSHINEVSFERDFDIPIAEELLDIVKHDFITRFKITEKGLGKSIILHGNVTFEKSGYIDWNPNSV